MFRRYNKQFSINGIAMEATPDAERTWLVRVQRTSTPIAVVRRIDPHGGGGGARRYITDNHPDKPFSTIEDAVAHMAREWRQEGRRAR
jgi:hypothetical protein